MTPAELTDKSALIQTPFKHRILAVFQGSIEFSEKGYRLFEKSLGTFLKMGRHSVQIGCLLRLNWVGTQFLKINYSFLTRSIATYPLVGLLYFLVDKQREFDELE